MSITPRVWVLTNAPSPYQVELFSSVAASQQVELDVRFLRDTSTPGPERQFPHHICRSWMTLSSGDELRVHGRAILEATFGQHDLYILSGLYTSVTFLACAWILFCRGKKWAIWWERPRPSKPEQRRFHEADRQRPDDARVRFLFRHRRPELPAVLFHRE